MTAGFVLSSDANYYEGAATVLRSLREHHDEPVTFFDAGLRDDQRRELADLVDAIVSLDGVLDRDVEVVPGQHVNPAALASVHSHLSGYDPVLYLDIDTLVLGSLHPMFRALESADIAGVQGNQFRRLDAGIFHRVVDEFTLDGARFIEERYPQVDLTAAAINTGCFAARAAVFERFSERVPELAPLLRHSKFVDQSLINLMIRLERLELALMPRAFNMMALDFRHADDPRSLINLRIDKSGPHLFMARDEIRCAHFSGKTKPWQVQNSSPGSLAWRYYRGGSDDDPSALGAAHRLSTRSQLPESAAELPSGPGSLEWTQILVTAQRLVRARRAGEVEPVIARLLEAHPTESQLHCLMFQIRAARNLRAALEHLEAAALADHRARREERIVRAMRRGDMHDLASTLFAMRDLSFGSLALGMSASSLFESEAVVRARGHLARAAPLEAAAVAQAHREATWAPVEAGRAMADADATTSVGALNALAASTDWVARARDLERRAAHGRFSRLEELIGDRAHDCSVLHVGAGFGEFAALLELSGHEALKIGGFTLHRSGARYEAADSDALSDVASERVEVVFAEDYMQHGESPVDALTDLTRVVAPGGVIVARLRTVGDAALCATEGLVHIAPRRDLTALEAGEAAAAAGLVNLSQRLVDGSLLMTATRPRPRGFTKIARRFGATRVGQSSAPTTRQPNRGNSVSEVWTRVNELLPSDMPALRALHVADARATPASRIHRWAAERLVEECAPLPVEWTVGDSGSHEHGVVFTGSHDLVLIDLSVRSDPDQLRLWINDAATLGTPIVTFNAAADGDAELLRVAVREALLVTGTGWGEDGDGITLHPAEAALSELWPPGELDQLSGRVLVHAPLGALDTAPPSERDRALASIAAGLDSAARTELDVTLLLDRGGDVVAEHWLGRTNSVRIVDHAAHDVPDLLRLLGSQDLVVGMDETLLWACFGLGTPTVQILPTGATSTFGERTGLSEYTIRLDDTDPSRVIDVVASAVADPRTVLDAANRTRAQLLDEHRAGRARVAAALRRLAR